ncbi:MULTISPECIES: 2-dehydropantoate 2-reductase [Rhodopseudomonas]|uniref:2-dehydropantoate 2-reductase n=1 Tax=Rhodopseudomonas palustris TaxID=1076 RepID=A0A0D7ED76_RHOPL|nr:MULTISPECIES: 2-dehydropantoate 2-reductase [Rhodopseudomonas]KIZ38769.1 2-dehydropantoate 2-reductase [Rhodopseudomonas palustris]MDF3808906.1 2-dehydropantoate 2-reductase [Rhodopseudomonas sp. BAL398]WOK17346.1 2-dehydropantoate 2-reductase [Rhodopseudomonas sp. BAL398]
MNIAVMGAGAVGCYYGAMLARAGHAVTLIGRQQHVDAIRQRGLLLDTASFSEPVAVAATTEIAGIAAAELVLFCVKSADTEPTGVAMAPHLRPDAVILSLQNGVDNAERLQATIGRPVVPVVVYVASAMAGPGHVKHNGRSELVLGRAPASEAIAACFNAAAIPTTVSDQVREVLWSKLILNCAYNALSAITQLPYGRLIQVDGVAQVMTDVVAECRAVAQASGVAVADDAEAKVIALAATMPAQYSSTAQDVARGKVSEIDYLNGHIVRQGVALGIPTPANRVLHTLMKLLEDKAQRPL